MPRYKDITGHRYPGSRLTPLYPTWETRGEARAMVWQCRCDCGRLHQATQGMLACGNVSSCGCLGRESRIARQKAKRDHRKEAEIARLVRSGLTQREVARRYQRTHQWVSLILQRMRREADGRRTENKRRSA